MLTRPPFYRSLSAILVRVDLVTRVTNPTDFHDRRRGARAVMRVPVEVRGVAGDGSSFHEETHTSVVGGLGALIFLSQLVKLGTEVEVTNRFSQQTARFRIVWVGEPGEAELREIGIESLEPLDDFWGVRFPPKPTS